jgi:F-type H+-transporting ATPase subunit a
VTIIWLAESDPLVHVVQHRLVAPSLLPGVKFLDHFTIVSNQTIMQVVAAVIVVLLLSWAVKRRAGSDELGRLVPRGWGNAIEGLCQALRVQVAQPALGPYADRIVPYLWSAFFFILTCNLLGLVPLNTWFAFVPGHPIGGTSTGNVMVTAALSICTLGMIVVSGLRLHGLNYVKHFFMGPPGLNVFIAVLEVVGLIAKTFALAMRLFANMIAGHVLLAVLLSFIAMSWNALGAAGGTGIGILVVLFSLFINFLELFVAFLQAFIFTFLSAMFIGMAVNIHAGHEHEHGEARAAAAAH